jgi:hypothetical protein
VSPDFRVTVATPLEFVSAVPEAGVKLPLLGVVTNVTTAFGTTVPFAFLTVAVSVAGLLVSTEVRTAEVTGSVSARVMVGVAVVVPPVPPVPPVEVPGEAPPPPQPESTAVIASSNDRKKPENVSRQLIVRILLILTPYITDIVRLKAA